MARSCTLTQHGHSVIVMVMGMCGRVSVVVVVVVVVVAAVVVEVVLVAFVTVVVRLTAE